MKRAWTALLSTSLLLTAVGCGSGQTPAPQPGGEKKQEAATGASKEPVKLRIAWWGGQARHDYTLKVIELYQQKNPNVKIEAEYSAFDDYWKKLAPQAAANQLPDIIQQDFAYIAQYGSRNQLEDLTPYTKNGKLNVADVNKNALSVGEVNGKLLAMNLGMNALGATADMEMLKKYNINVPGKDWTWDDLESIGAKLKSNGKILGTFDHKNWFGYYLRTQDKSLYSKDGTALGYDDDKLFVDYYKRYQKWYDAGYILTLDKEAQKKKTPEDDEMVFGNAFSMNGWSNQFVAFSQAAKRPTVLQPYPGPNQKRGLYLKPSMFFSVASSSKVKDEAVKFIDFFINDVDANKIIKGERGVPVSSKIKEAIKPLLSPLEVATIDYVTWAESNSSPVNPPDPVGSAEVEKMLKDTVEQMMYKKISVEDAAAKFRKDANAVLAKNKK